MSLIWSLVIDSVSLFTKLKPDEVRCNVCDPNSEKPPIKLAGRNTTNLFTHAKTHEAYRKLLEELQAKEEKNRLFCTALNFAHVIYQIYLFRLFLNIMK